MKKISDKKFRVLMSSLWKDDLLWIPAVKAQIDMGDVYICFFIKKDITGELLYGDSFFDIEDEEETKKILRRIKNKIEYNSKSIKK